MNTPSQPFDPAADERAALWAARLDGSSFSAEDRAELDAWLAASPTHRTLLSQYCQFSADLEQHLPALVESGAVSMPAIASPARRRLRSWRALWVGGFLGAATAAVALTLHLSAPDIESRNVATAVAQRQALTLSDGSRIELNAHTTLRVELARDERRVRLAQGQAFFAVSKDPKRPFIVETPSGSVRVTGTSFDVRTESAASLEVTVLEGSVQVRSGSAAPFALGAYDAISVTPAGAALESLSPNALADRLAWREGRVVFNDTPLRDALARFSRYHGRNLTAAPAVADLRIGGRFSLDDLDGFFTALEAIHPVQILRDPDGSIQVTARPAP